MRPSSPRALKGFEEPVGAWRVVRERTIASRFETLRAAGLTPLIGREEEMELLLRRWEQIKDGRRPRGAARRRARHRQVAPDRGAGRQSQRRTRMSACATSASRIIRAARCSRSWRSSSTLRGSIRRHRRRRGAPSSKSSCAGAAARTSSRSRSCWDGQRPPARRHDPQRKRRAVLGALIEHLEALTRHGPVLMVFEDAHWADPTSLELLTLTIERVQTLPVLLVITFPPGLSAAVDRPTPRHHGDAQPACPARARHAGRAHHRRQIAAARIARTDRRSHRRRAAVRRGAHQGTARERAIARRPRPLRARTADAAACHPDHTASIR